jgi:hypothetical protein
MHMASKWKLMYIGKKMWYPLGVVLRVREGT